MVFANKVYTLDLQSRKVGSIHYKRMNKMMLMMNGASRS